MKRLAWPIVLVGVLGGSAEAQTRLQVESDLDLARPEEVVEVPAASLAGLAKPGDLPKVRVADETGRDLLAQAVDQDGDAVPDQLVFLADFAPKQARTFVLSLGERRVLRKEDFRVYGRFVRERHDDFAWENDRVAHRVYGAALETWDAGTAHRQRDRRLVQAHAAPGRERLVHDGHVPRRPRRGRGLLLGGPQPRLRRQRDLARRPAVGVAQLPEEPGAGGRPPPPGLRARLRALRRRWFVGGGDQAGDRRRRTQPASLREPLPALPPPGPGRAGDHLGRGDQETRRGGRALREARGHAAHLGADREERQLRMCGGGRPGAAPGDGGPTTATRSRSRAPRRRSPPSTTPGSAGTGAGTSPTRPPGTATSRTSPAGCPHRCASP